MMECSAVERIAQRVTHELHEIEWALQFKRGLLADAELAEDEAAVAELRRDIQHLEFQAGLHKVAVGITRAALL